MNTELKEKMQKAANDFLQKRQTANGRKETGSYPPLSWFMAGASAMYSELAPLVEWVSVEDRLPEPSFEQVFLVKGLVRHKKYGWIPYYPATRLRSICNGVPIWRGFENDENHKITHWRKIEL